jgi:hypothetical protein
MMPPQWDRLFDIGQSNPKALWFWDVGGFAEKRPLPANGHPLRVGVVACYTCSATFAWPSGTPPQCPVCRSRGTCNSGPALSIPGALDIQVSAGYVRDDDEPPLPWPHGPQG